MDTIQTKTNNNTNNIFAVLSYIVIGIGFLFAFFALSEFYKVKFGGLESAYAFGAGDNADDWVYKTASNYSNYMLIIGLLFFAASVVALAGQLRRKRKIVFISISLIILIFFFNLFR